LGAPGSPLIAFEAGAGPLYRQIYAGYRAAILEGRLRPGERVPSSRALARELGISRLPVLNAFEQLLHEGYLEGRGGSGTYVAALVPVRGGAGGPSAAMARVPADAPGAQQAAAHAPPAPTEHAAFRVSLPALERFPRATWARLVARNVRNMPLSAMAYGDPAGEPALREAIAAYLRSARAVRCEASQVLVLPGSQMALQLCARVLLQPGDRVCIEEPGYPGAHQAFGAAGAKLHPVPVDAHGLVVEALAPASRAVYVTPSHQYPLGVSMHAARRLALLAWARQHRAWIVEDDYDSDFRYASRPLGSLQGMQHGANVIYVGSFSKVLFPALRIGYLVVPPELARRFVEERSALDLFSPTLHQLALCDFLREGHFVRHVRRMRSVYRARRDALVEAIGTRLGTQLQIVNSDAGMHLAAWLPPAVDDLAVVRCAAKRGVSATALSTCHAGNAPRSGLVLGFSGAAEAEIERAVGMLAEAIAECTIPNRPRRASRNPPHRASENVL
jgi:GntR family transcriptional regulator/MocR family aminotransferase